MKTARKQATRLLQLMLVASLVLPAVLFVFAGWVSYRNFQAVGDDRIEGSLDILHEHALKVFQTVELTFGQVNEVMRGLSDEAILADEGRLHERLDLIVKTLPQLQGIAILDRGGHTLVSSNLFPARHDASLADRDYFQAHVGGNGGTYVSPMLQPRLPGISSDFFALTRSRPPANGAFNGIITIAVLPGYFESFYRQMAQNREGAYYAIARRDGSFLARYPVPANRAARLDANSALRQHIARGLDRSIFEVESQIDHVDRRIGYRKLTGFPVYVMAGIETAALRAEWLRYMSSHLVFGLPATAVMFAIIILALRRTRRFYDAAEGREAAEAQLRQSQRLEAIGQMTGGIAHDFNNLLMIVSGSAQRLRQQLTEPKYRRPIDMILTATRRGESLTRQLLAYSRQQTLAPQVIDLCHRLAAVKELLARSLRGDIDIKVEVPDEPCSVRVDPGELELALLNLAVNSQDAMPNGGTLSVRVKAVNLRGEAGEEGLRGEFIALRITDTGTGIEPKVLARVFEPFFTTKDIGKGTGLGLSQVYGFAKQSGGIATVTSAPGRGTTITIYLPRTHEAAASDAPAPEAKTQNHGAGTILLVEDNPDVAEVGASYLQQLGYCVRSVDNARAALSALRSDSKIDLVFSDILMPGGMNGLDLARQIREEFPNIPVLLTTGYSGSAQDAVRHGVVVLQKPYDMRALEKNVREAIQAASRRRGLEATHQ
jgi:two-component system NtrC family sensor kinase